jgi:hypothetical protein
MKRREAIMRLTISVILALTLAGPGFAGQNDDTKSSGHRKGAIVGTLVGLGAGIASAAIYGTMRDDLCDNAGGSDNYSAAGCYTPMAGMIAGGTIVGYFIGRHADRRAERKSSLGTTGVVRKPFTVAAPTVRLTTTRP